MSSSEIVPVLTLEYIMAIIYRAWKFFKRKWHIFFIYLIVGGGIGLVYSSFQKKEYVAECKFIIKDQNSSSLNLPLSSLTNLLGVPTYSPSDRALAVISTDRILRPSLFTSCIVNKKSELIINHLLNNMKSNAYLSYPISKNFFSIQDSAQIMPNIEKAKIYKELVKHLILSNNVIRKSFDKKSGIITIQVFYDNQEIAAALNFSIISTLKSFFIFQNNESLTVNADIINKKADSLYRRLSTVRASIANFSDQSNSIFFNRDKVVIKDLLMQEQLLSGAYFEIKKNLETLSILGQSTSNNSTFIILDYPSLPLEVTTRSQYFYAVIFASLFLFIYLLFILFSSYSKFKQKHGSI